MEVGFGCWWDISGFRAGDGRMQSEESGIIDSQVKEIHEAKGLGTIEFLVASPRSLRP